MKQSVTRVIGYVRVSTDGQAESGLSLESQAEKLRAYAALYDLNLVDVITDAGQSAKTLNRPGLTAALDMLKSGAADALLVAKLDRLTRSVTDLGTLVTDYFSERRRWNLISVNDHVDTRTASGRLVLNVLASVSQWEREAIAERTSDALKQKRARGEFAGGKLRYGLKNDGGHIVADEKEVALLDMARRLRSAGLSLRSIAAEMEVAGYVARNGQRISAPVISRMLSA